MMQTGKKGEKKREMTFLEEIEYGGKVKRMNAARQVRGLPPLKSIPTWSGSGVKQNNKTIIKVELGCIIFFLIFWLIVLFYYT